MPLNSVNTNIGAMVALQHLNAISREMLTVQTRITTGKKINSAKDNGAVWAIAQNQRADMRALDSVKSSLQRGQSAVDVALSAGESISDVLNEMRETMLSASDPSNTPETKAALNTQYLALRRQINTIANQAEFNGINLINAGTGQVRALANARGTDTIDVGHVNLTMTGAGLSGLPADLTGTIGTAELDTMSAAISTVNGGIATLGSGSKRLDMHLEFVGKQQDTLEEGIGRLVDADMAKESARFQALQVMQQLAMQALQIANQAPSLLLQLFR